MSKIILAGIAIILGSSAFAYTGFGVCNFGNQSVDAVICNEPTVMKETHVAGDIKVTGALHAENISARGIFVTGSVDIKNSQVSGAVNVTGSFSADNVQFAQGIAITSKEVTLNKSKVNGMVTMTSDKSPHLYVCSSEITGSIFFDGAAGVVSVTGDSKIGKVSNGSLIFVKNEECGK